MRRLSTTMEGITRAKRYAAESTLTSTDQTSKKIIPNSFLSPPTEIQSTNSKRGRSVSLAASERSARSSLSRITLVEEDSRIPIHPDPEDSASIVTSDYSCLGHLMAIIRIIFRIPVSKKMKTKSALPVSGGSCDVRKVSSTIELH